MSEIHLSVIIPAHNEEKRLPKTLAEIDDYLGRQNYSSEVIVVNAASSDKTGEIARQFSAKVIELPNSRGKGHAVKEGILAASGEFRLFADADNSTSIDQVEKMWPYFQQGYGVVIGSRDAKGAVLDPPQPFLRKFILGKGFRIFRKLVLGFWDIQDTQCGFKCFTAKAAQDIFPRLTVLGFSFDTEVLLLAKKFGYKVKEVPVHWKNDLESKVKLGDTIKMAIDLIIIRFKNA